MIMMIITMMMMIIMIFACIYYDWYLGCLYIVYGLKK